MLPQLSPHYLFVLISFLYLAMFLLYVGQKKKSTAIHHNKPQSHLFLHKPPYK